MNEGYLAFLPMSLQPLHNGHINVILNIIRQYPEAHITINEETTAKRPFPVDLRMRWLEKALDHYGVESVTLSTRDDFYQYAPETIRERYLGYAKAADRMSLVSGNPQAPKVAAWMGIEWHDVHTMALQPLVGNLPEKLMHHRENNASCIRQAIIEGESLPEGYLPSFICRDELAPYLLR
jgi:hypothetical protein